VPILTNTSDRALSSFTTIPVLPFLNELAAFPDVAVPLNLAGRSRLLSRARANFILITALGASGWNGGPRFANQAALDGTGLWVCISRMFVLYSQLTFGHARILSLPHAAIVFMLALTAISQFIIIPRMDVLRAQGGEIAALSADNPIRQSFDSLHVWSTRLEAIVLLLGLVLLYMTSRRLASSRS